MGLWCCAGIIGAAVRTQIRNSRHSRGVAQERARIAPRILEYEGWARGPALGPERPRRRPEEVFQRRGLVSGHNARNNDRGVSGQALAKNGSGQEDGALLGRRGQVECRLMGEEELESEQDRNVIPGGVALGEFG
jgi:hypothetical protein